MKLNDGEIPRPVSLREGDYFTETATEINRLIEKMKFEKNKCQLMKEQIKAILAASPQGSVGTAAQALKVLLEKEAEG